MFKELIKELRTKNNLTMRAFGETIGVSGATVSNYESGKKKPGPETLEKISEVYNVSKEWLMGEVHGAKETVTDAVNRAITSDEAVAAEIEIKKNARKITRKAEEAVEPITKAARKAVAPDVIIESMLGGQISTSDIVKRLPKGVTAVYVKPEENKAYYQTEEGVHSIDLW